MNNFVPLVKIAKNKMELIQKDLFEAMGRLARRENEIAALRQELLDLTPPVDGLMSQLVGFRNMQQIVRDEIVECENDMAQIQNLINALKQLVKKAQIELEKVEYLSNDYELKKQARRDKQEQLLLEEAGVNSYIFKGEGRV